MLFAAKIYSWGRRVPFPRRWWWLGLPIPFLVLALGVNEWRVHREFQGAERRFQEDRLKDAQRQLQSYLEDRPDHFEAHLLAARVDRLLGSYAGAENHL